MEKNYNEESFKKGEQFENYVEEVIFPVAHYDLVHKTSDSKQNTRRFVQKSLEPDFRFKCRVTGKEFYVEAKWRAKPYKDLYEVLSEKQFHSFPNIHSPQCPIFIAFGYGGQACNPDYVSLIPLDKVRTSKISPSEVYSFNIEKSHYPNKLFIQQENERDEDNEPIENQELLQELKKTEPEKGFQKYNSKILALAVVGLVAVILSIYSFAFSSESSVITPEEQLKEIVADYYQSMNSNQIEKLPEFLSPQVTYWYGEENPSREWIYRNAKAHRGRYPYSASEINWDSFKVAQESSGGYHVSYEMIYKAKSKITDDYKVFDLKLITKWDNNYKLKSISEIRN